MSKYVCFDLEISKVLPDTKALKVVLAQLKAINHHPSQAALESVIDHCADWDNFRPLGVSCAATYDSDGNAELWHGGSANVHGSLPYSMTPGEIDALVHYLARMQESGYQIVTFNGCGFDFKTLAFECGETADLCRELALSHVDIFFHFFASRGHTVSLKAACAGMCVEGKTKGMDGAKAPEMWSQGRSAQQKVLDYCAQDVRATAALYEAIEQRGRLDWIAKSGNLATWDVPGGLVTVQEAMELPLPDTSWMKGREPWKRERFYEWTTR